MRDRRRLHFEYCLRVARFMTELEPERNAELEQWRDRNPQASDLDWPVIVQRFGRRPGRGPALIAQIRRTA